MVSIWSTIIVYETDCNKVHVLCALFVMCLLYCFLVQFKAKYCLGLVKQ